VPKWATFHPMSSPEDVVSLASGSVGPLVNRLNKERPALRTSYKALAPDQCGFTAHRVGRRAMAAAHDLHYQVGIPVRKAPLVLELLSGMELTQGAISQDA
jgi:hypothetical protein